MTKNFDESISSQEKDTTSSSSVVAREVGAYGVDTSSSDVEIDQNPKENTRRIIASLYVWAFFIIIFITLIIGVLFRYSVDDYKDILVTVSGILSGPLGFIVGYYFKSKNE